MKKSIFKTGVITAFLVLLFVQSWAQIEVVECYSSDGKPKSKGTRWIEYKDGVTYDCICTGSGTQCTAQISSSSGSGNNSSSENTSVNINSELSTSQADLERQQAADKAQTEIERQKDFETGLNDLRNSLKRETSMGTPVLKTGTSTTSSSTSLPLKVTGNSQSQGFTTANSTAREKTIKALKELNCAAFWGLEYAVAVLKSRSAVTNNLEDKYTAARKYSENSVMAKDGKTVSGCPEIKISVPDVPPPMETNPQIQVYNYIIEQTNTIVPAIIETQKKLDDSKLQLKKIEIEKKSNRKEIEQIVSNLIITKPGAEKTRLASAYKESNEKYDELSELAKQVDQESTQLNSDADKYVDKVNDLQNIYTIMQTNPERAKEFIKQEVKNE